MPLTMTRSMQCLCGARYSAEEWSALPKGTATRADGRARETRVCARCRAAMELVDDVAPSSRELPFTD